MKDSNRKTKAPIILTSPKLAAVFIIPILILFLVAPRLTFWSGPPTVYYIGTIMERTSLVMGSTDESLDNLFDSYKNKQSQKLISSELVLLTALGTELARDTKDLAPDEKFNLGLKLLMHTQKILKEADERGPSLFEYSFVQLLSPSGLAEGLLLVGIESEVLEKFQENLANSSKRILTGLEKILEKKDLENKADYILQIKNLKKEFEALKSYQLAS